MNDPRTGRLMARLPRWLPYANRIITWLQRHGVAFFTFHLLTVPGRVSGRPRTTPVSPVFLADGTYIVSVGDAEWVRNARAAGRGTLARGRRERDVRLTEVPLPARGRVLREFPAHVRRGVGFFVRLGVVDAPGDADAFERAAGRLAVFRADPVGVAEIATAPGHQAS